MHVPNKDDSNIHRSIDRVSSSGGGEGEASLPKHPASPPKRKREGKRRIGKSQRERERERESVRERERERERGRERGGEKNREKPEREREREREVVR